MKNKDRVIEEDKAKLYWDSLTDQQKSELQKKASIKWTNSTRTNKSFTNSVKHEIDKILTEMFSASASMGFKNQLIGMKALYTVI